MEQQSMDVYSHLFYFSKCSSVFLIPIQMWILRVEIGRVLWWWIIHRVLGWKEMVLLLTNLILWLIISDCRIQEI